MRWDILHARVGTRTSASKNPLPKPVSFLTCGFGIDRLLSSAICASRNDLHILETSLQRRINAVSGRQRWCDMSRNVRPCEAQAPVVFCVLLRYFILFYLIPFFLR